MKLILDRMAGLGDNLQVSTIPRRFYEKYGEKCVYISEKCYYRNKEIRELVWERNPYIAGFTNESGIDIHPYITFQHYWIEEMERIYGLEEPFSIKPDVFYDSNVDKFNVKNKIIVDLSYSDQSYKENIINRPNSIVNIKNYFGKIDDFSNIYIITFNNLINNINHKEFWKEIFPNNLKNIIYVNNIYEYYNIIKYCKSFICSHSGCNVFG